MKKLIFAAACAGLLACAGSANADGLNDQLNIKAEIISGCNLNFNSSNLDFGKINRDKPADAIITSNFVVACGGEAVQVKLDAGQNAAGNQRQMALQGSAAQAGEKTVLAYQVFQGTAGSTEWNDSDYAYNVDGAATAGDGQPNSFNLKVPAGFVSPNLAAGIYTDTLTATVTYGTGS